DSQGVAFCCAWGHRYYYVDSNATVLVATVISSLAHADYYTTHGVVWILSRFGQCDIILWITRCRSNPASFFWFFYHRCGAIFHNPASSYVKTTEDRRPACAP